MNFVINEIELLKFEGS